MSRRFVNDRYLLSLSSFFLWCDLFDDRTTYIDWKYVVVGELIWRLAATWTGLSFWRVLLFIGGFGKLDDWWVWIFENKIYSHASFTQFDRKAYHKTHSVPVVTSHNSRGHGMDCVARQSGNVIHCFIWHHDLCTTSKIPERPWNGTGFENALPKYPDRSPCV